MVPAPVVLGVVTASVVPGISDVNGGCDGGGEGGWEGGGEGGCDGGGGG